MAKQQQPAAFSVTFFCTQTQILHTRTVTRSRSLAVALISTAENEMKGERDRGNTAVTRCTVQCTSHRLWLNVFWTQLQQATAAGGVGAAAGAAAAAAPAPSPARLIFFRFSLRNGVAL